MKQQRGNTALTLILVIGTLAIVIGSLKECSRNNFEKECEAVKGIVVGDVCIKPDSVIKKRI